jgi:hypothetical protein
LKIPLETRIETLAEQGWTLVHASEEHVEHDTIDGQAVLRPVNGVYRFETHWRGAAHSVVQHSLERAVEATEAEQARISALADRPSPVIEGAELLGSNPKTPGG